MKHPFSIALAVIALASLACNSLIKLPLGNLTAIPLTTFSIDQAIPDGTSPAEVALTLAPSTATLTVAGGAGRLVQGEIQYNIAEWRPALATDQSSLRIEQRLPDDTIASTPEGAVNQWNLKLSDSLTTVLVDFPAGDLTVDLADTLANNMSISITVGAANLRLVIPTEVAASVEVHRGPSSVSTEGAWTADGNRYTTSSSGPKWAITINMGVGNLTLTSQ